MWRLRVSPRQGLQTQQQVLAHRELGDDLAALGHVADAGPGPLVGRQGGEVPLADLHGATALAQQTDHRFEHGGFAHAVEADQADHLGGLHAQVHIAKDVAFAVENIEAPQGQLIAGVTAGAWRGNGRGRGRHAMFSTLSRSSVSTPRYTSITRGSLCTSSIGPSQSTWPSCNTVTWESSWRMKSMSCSITSTV